jgi:uncharacterized membrane protein YedE/YeeE
MDEFFPQGAWHYLLGGLLIGAGVALLFVTTGLIGGTSTVFSAVWSFVSRRPFFQQPKLVDSRGWRIAYALGMVLGVVVVVALTGPQPVTSVTWPFLLVGGLIGGFGARLGSGCTSGHGICGLASLQLPSLVAVLTFLATAMITANLVVAFGGRS